MGGSSYAGVARRASAARAEAARGDRGRRRSRPESPAGATEIAPDEGRRAGAEAPVHVAEEEWTRIALGWLGAADAAAGPAGGPAARTPSRQVVWELRPGEVVVGCERLAVPAGPGGLAPLGGVAAARVVRLDEAARALAQRRGAPEHRAALVTVEVERGRRVLVDLLAAGLTSLEGGPRDCDTFVRRLVGELAERRWSPLGRLVVVGLPDLEGALATRERTTRLGGVDELEATGLLDGVDLCDALLPGARGAGRGASDCSGSTLVILGGEVVAALDDDLAARLAATARAGHGGQPSLALLAGAPWPASSWILTVAPGGGRAELRAGDGQRSSEKPRASSAPRGAARPTARPTARAAALATAVLESAGPAPVAPEVAEVPPGAAASTLAVEGADVAGTAIGPRTRLRGSRGPSVAAEIPDVATEIQVAVLGRAEVRGVPASFAGRPRLTELVVYLALHPDGATAASWSTALWPRRRVPCQTMSNRVSEARHLLGLAADGRPRLRRAGDVYRLAEVSTDWQRFKSLCDRAMGVESWREALALVRGRPLQDLSSSLWTALEYMGAEMERVVSECALLCGRTLLDAGDHSGAEWAAQQGLRASPWDERLVRLRMTTADAAGNRAGIEAVVRHLLLVMEIEGDPRDQLHPETLALYRRLTGHELAPRH